MTAAPPRKLRPTRARLAALACVVLLLVTVRISQDERGVWQGEGPGFEVILIPDQAGPAAWLYVAGHLVWHVAPVRSEPPQLRPTATPGPRRLRPVELEQAQKGHKISTSVLASLNSMGLNFTPYF